MQSVFENTRGSTKSVEDHYVYHSLSTQITFTVIRTVYRVKEG
jgi:hypothetical protein